MPANKERSAASTAATRELVRSWSHPKRTTDEVAKLCGVSRSTAAQHLAALRRDGVIPPPDPRLGRDRRPAYCTPARDRLAEAGAADLAAAGKSAAEIARATGVSHDVVSLWARRAGIELSKGGIPSHEQRLGPQLRRLAAAGRTVVEIEQATGINRKSVRRWARREGVKIRRGNRAKLPEQRRDLLESGLTFAAAARRSGVTTPALVRWARVAGVKRADRATLTARVVSALLIGTWRMDELATIARVDPSLLPGILEAIDGAGITLRKIGGGRRWSADLPVRDVDAQLLARLSTESWLTTRDLAAACRLSRDAALQALSRLERQAPPRLEGKRAARDATEREWRLLPPPSVKYDLRKDSIR